VPYADAAEVLARLRRRRAHPGLVSNIGFELRPIPAAHGLLDAFDELVQSYEVGIRDPEAGPRHLPATRSGWRRSAP
jgi:putative hydrolase of the HAD superfamily